LSGSSVFASAQSWPPRIPATISDGLGGEHGHSYGISFHHVNGREICRIAVDPAPKPVYVKGEMSFCGAAETTWVRIASSVADWLYQTLLKGLF
jgi:hypothetical protein